MKAILTAKLQHMAAEELLAMVPADTLARIRLSDPNPEIRAYVIAHEGEAEGNMVGFGRRVMQYFRDAIIRLHDRLKIGTAVFHRHGQTNDHAGREAIGELVGKSLQTIRGKLHDVAAVYIAPKHRTQPLDIASIEADVVFTETEDPAKCRAVDIGDITGIALSSSAVERPGFGGATLLATVQAFVEGETHTMTLEELRKAVAESKAKPSDLYPVEELTKDPAVTDRIDKSFRAGKGEARKEMQTDIDDANKRIETLQKERDTAKGEALRSRASATLEALAAGRKLTPEQKAFVQRRFDGFKTEAADEAGLKTDLQKHLDAELKEFDEVARLMGIKPAEGEKKPETGTPSADGKTTADGSDLTDPANNDFIPQTPKA